MDGHQKIGNSQIQYFKQENSIFPELVIAFKFFRDYEMKEQGNLKRILLHWHIYISLLNNYHTITTINYYTITNNKKIGRIKIGHMAQLHTPNNLLINVPDLYNNYKDQMTEICND